MGSLVVEAYLRCGSFAGSLSVPHVQMVDALLEDLHDEVL
jgi:hypothetical protein